MEATSPNTANISLAQAVSCIDKSEQNEASIDFEELCLDLRIDAGYGWYPEFDKRLKGYWMFNWHCTDEWVGFALIFMDGDFVGTSMKSGRKSSAEFKWVSAEKAEQVRTFVRSLVDSEDTFSPSICNMEECFTPTFNVQFSGEILRQHYHGFWKGEPVSVTQVFTAMDEIDRWRSVGVKTKAGKEVVIPMSEYDIPMNLAVTT